MPDTPMTSAALREALEDLWACIGKDEIAMLHPETVRVAQENHEELCHSGEGTPWWVIWRR